MLDRIRRLETRVDELARGTLAHAVVSFGGITIRDLGGLKLLDQDGDTVFYIGGYSGPFARPDGMPQPVTVISDDRGNARIAVFDDNPTGHPYRQYVGIWDYSGNIIVGDDARSGQGLARPYIGGTVSRARYTDWPSTSATDWDALEKLSINRQHSSSMSTSG